MSEEEELAHCLRMARTMGHDWDEGDLAARFQSERAEAFEAGRKLTLADAKELLSDVGSDVSQTMFGLAYREMRAELSAADARLARVEMEARIARETIAQAATPTKLAMLALVNAITSALADSGEKP